MTLVHGILLVVHLLGWAALFGGMVVQAREPVRRVNGAMRDGVGTAFLAGLLLVGVLEAGADPVDRVKIGVKFGIGLVLLILVMVNMRKPQIPTGLFFGLLALTLTNVCIAVLW